MCICRLTLAWISSETSTKLLGMPTYLDRSSSLLWSLSHAHSSLCCPVSTGHSRHPSPTAPSEFLCPTLWLAFPSYFRSRRDRGSGFAPKQTKESSAWRTTYIVLQVYYIAPVDRGSINDQSRLSQALKKYFSTFRPKHLQKWTSVMNELVERYVQHHLNILEAVVIISQHPALCR